MGVNRPETGPFPANKRRSPRQKVAVHETSPEQTGDEARTFAPEAEAVARLTRVRSTGARQGKLWNPDGPGAAAIIEQQAAEIARLKAALPQAGEPSPAQGVKPLDWRKPTRSDEDHGHTGMIWIASGIGGRYAIEKDLKKYIVWHADDQYAFDTLDTVEAAKAWAEADWQEKISRKLTAPAQPDAGDLRDLVHEALTGAERWLDWCIHEHYAPDSSQEQAALAKVQKALAALTGTQQAKGEG